MSGIAPEPADRAIARVMAGGLEDPEADFAARLAALLNDGIRLAIAVIPHEGDWHNDPAYCCEGRTAHTVTWDRAASTWTVSAPAAE